jgi:UDP-N-acetylglucosamine 2-epimerase (non-hydrolysing)
MIEQIIDSLNMSYSIDFNLNIMKNNQSLPELTSKIILELNKIYSLVGVNAVIVQGDTTSSFAAALSAFYLKIPVFHVEAGLRTYNIFSPYPEEFNRIAIDDISSLYFAATELAASNLIKENKNHSKIYITGNTIVDALKLTIEKTTPSNYLQSVLKKYESRCKPKQNCRIILLTCHRRENYFNPIINIIKSIIKLLKDFEDIVIFLPFHLNPNVRLSIKMGLPGEIYNEIINGKFISNKN